MSIQLKALAQPEAPVEFEAPVQEANGATIESVSSSEIESY